MTTMSNIKAEDFSNDEKMELRVRQMSDRYMDSDLSFVLEFMIGRVYFLQGRVKQLEAEIEWDR